MPHDPHHRDQKTRGTTAAPGPPPVEDARSEQEIRDRQMIELLNELRVALPGVQILFAFLLIVPFSQGYEKMTTLQNDVYTYTLLATALSTACLIAPTAAHRLRFHQRDRAWVIETANKLSISGLVFLAIAITGAVFLVMDFIYDGVRSWLFAAIVAAALLLLWFIRPAVRSESSGP